MYVLSLTHTAARANLFALRVMVLLAGRCGLSKVRASTIPYFAYPFSHVKFNVSKYQCTTLRSEPKKYA